MNNLARGKRVLDSEDLQCRARWYVGWLRESAKELEREWDRPRAATTIERWAPRDFVAVRFRLLTVLERYFARSMALLKLLGQPVRLSKRSPLMYAVDFELWREQWEVRSPIYVPNWSREIERQHRNTLCVYARLDLLTRELHRRLRKPEVDLLLGVLFDRPDAYRRTMKRLLRWSRQRHPDDPHSRGEEKEGVIDEALTEVLSKAAHQPIPTCDPERLGDIALDPNALGDLETACRIAKREPQTEESLVDRRDSELLLQVLSGGVAYLKLKIDNDVIDLRRRIRAKKRSRTRLPGSIEDLIDGNEREGHVEGPLLLPALTELNDRLDELRQVLDIEKAAQALTPTSFQLLQTIFTTTGEIQMAELARLYGVSRPTIYKWREQLAAELRRWGFRQVQGSGPR